MLVQLPRATVDVGDALKMARRIASTRSRETCLDHRREALCFGLCPGPKVCPVAMKVGGHVTCIKQFTGAYLSVGSAKL